MGFAPPLISSELETRLSIRTRRHLELLDLVPPLRRYASSLQSDQNASWFLVHEALAAAFAEAPGLRALDGLEASLRQHIADSFALGERHAAA